MAKLITAAACAVALWSGSSSAGQGQFGVSATLIQAPAKEDALISQACLDDAASEACAESLQASSSSCQQIISAQEDVVEVTLVCE